MENERKDIALSDAEIQKLTARIKMLEDITRSMAHNCRGAAAGIKMMNTLLLKKANAGFLVDEAGKLQAQKILQCIGNSSDSLMQTLEEMMDFVNHDLDNDKQYVDCDIKKISDRVVAQLYGTAIRKQAKFKFKIAMQSISYPKVYLESMLYNLVSNAIKYSRPGVQPEIVISSAMVSGRRTIAVADNGLGIDMLKYGEKIFKLNQTFHSGCDSKGIGLFITKGQIESLGGHIAVKSEVGKGTRFIVTL